VRQAGVIADPIDVDGHMPLLKVAAQYISSLAMTGDSAGDSRLALRYRRSYAAVVLSDNNQNKDMS
jgi:hypothetical protein